MGISVSKFFTHLLGKSELNSLAGRSTQFSNTFGDNDFRIFNRGDLDGSFLRKVFARHNRQINGFVNAGLDGFRVGNGDRHINRGDNGDIVGSFLGNFFAVVVTITMVPVAMSRLADCDHLDVSLLFKSDLNSFGGGVFGFLNIFVGTDLLGNNCDTSRAYSSCDCVSKVNVNDIFDGQSHILTNNFDCGSTHFSIFHYINN